ncbi:MAG: hypothetical protein AAF843_17840 [Bacteroidota bacterium]
MDIEKKLDQLTSLMSDLIPTVDKLAVEVKTLTEENHKANIERSELRLSNIRLAEAIESLNSK